MGKTFELTVRKVLRPIDHTTQLGINMVKTKIASISLLSFQKTQKVRPTSDLLICTGRLRSEKMTITRVWKVLRLPTIHIWAQVSRCMAHTVVTMTRQCSSNVVWWRASLTRSAIKDDFNSYNLSKKELIILPFYLK